MWIIRNAIVYTILLSIYLTGTYVDTGFGFTVYWFYYPYAALILWGFATAKIDIKIVFVLLGLTVWSFLTSKLSYPLVIKQLFNIAFNVFAFYFLLRLEKFNFEEVFRKYIKVTKIVVVLGFLQVAMVLAGYQEMFRGVLFPFLEETNMSFRFQSITAEPSFYTVAATPAMFLAFYNLVYRRNLYIGKFWSVLIIASYLLTLATTAFIAFGVTLLVLYFKNFTYTKLAFSGVVVGMVLLAGIIAYNNVEMVKERIDDTLTGITGDFVKDNRYRQLHMSSYMMITNMYVALNSFKEHPITGYGFGSHEKAYDKFLPDVMLRYSTLGRGDAGSLVFRLITEMGLIGLIVFLYFTAKYRIKSRSSFDDHQQVLWLINASVFVLIVLYLARNGNYTINGKMFFLLMYYYTAQALQGKWLPPYLRGEEAKEGTPVPTLA